MDYADDIALFEETEKEIVENKKGSQPKIWTKLGT